MGGKFWTISFGVLACVRACVWGAWCAAPVLFFCVLVVCLLRVLVVFCQPGFFWLINPCAHAHTGTKACAACVGYNSFLLGRVPENSVETGVSVIGSR